MGRPRGRGGRSGGGQARGRSLQTARSHEDPEAWVDEVGPDAVRNVIPGTSLPADLLWRAYRLDNLCATAEAKHKENCQSNPMCLAALRLIKDNTASINKLVAKIVGQPPPALSDEEEGEKDKSGPEQAEPKVVGDEQEVPVALESAAEQPLVALKLTRRGIRNSGNTCYINAVLQLLFHSPTVRRIVFEAANHTHTHSVSSPTETGTSSSATRVKKQPRTEQSSPTKRSDENQSASTDAASESKVTLHSLCCLFAEMAIARYPCADAGELLSHLHIDPRVQQDAQEFLGLFLTWLEKALSMSLPAAIPSSQIFRKEFESGAVNVRRCLKCSNVTKKAEVFSFFSVPVKSHIMDSLMELLAVPEVIEGVFCEKCQQHVSIEQTVELRLLPETIILHLNRFRYDLQNGTRVKLSDNVLFPTVINMGKFLPAEQNQQQPTEVLYALDGVVNHLGQSPNSGHYTFHARDGPDAWSCYDDSSVSRLRKYYGETTTSRDAYLLVYRRRAADGVVGGVASEADGDVTKTIPRLLVEYIQAKHQDVATARAAWQSRQDQVKKEVQEWATLATTVFTPVVPDGSAPLYFAPRRWLAAFGNMFTSPADHDEAHADPEAVICDSPSPADPSSAENNANSSSAQGSSIVNEKADAAASPAPYAFNYSGLLCPHGLLEPSADFKVISEEAFLLLFEKYSTLMQDTGVFSTENDAMCSVCASKLIQAKQERRRLASLEESMMSLAKVENVQHGGMWISKDFLTRWCGGQLDASGAKSLSGPSAVDMCFGLVCSHGGLRPDAIIHAVTNDVWQFLKETKGFSCSASFPATVERCPACIQLTIQDTSERHGLKMRKLKEHKVLPTLAFAAQFPNDINRAVFKKDIAKYTKQHRKKWQEAQQQQQTATTLLPSATVTIHKNQQPQTPPARSAAIDVDAADGEEKDDDDDSVVALSSGQGGNNDGCPPRVVEYFCVPTAWAEAWRAWQKDTSGSVPPPGPPLERLHDFLCPHRGLPFPAGSLHPDRCPQHQRPVLTILGQNEFDELMKSYYAPPPTPTAADASSAEASPSSLLPPLPVPPLLIKMREVDDRRELDPATCDACAKELEDRERAARFCFVDSGIVSISARVKLSKRGKYLDETETFAGLSHTETLLELAGKLSTRLLERHGLLVSADDFIFCKGKTNLPDTSKCLSHYSIASGDTITASTTEVAQKVETHSTRRDVAGGPTSFEAVAKTSETDVTFTGTRLSGWMPSPPRGGVTSAGLEPGAVVECGVCTYHNTPGSKQCEMCMAPL